jgi:hypothetical protein
LHTTATVDVFTAVLGGEADVETLSGKVKLNIPEGTQPEQVFRLAGRGMPTVKNAKEKGDLYVRLKVQIPKYLSAKQRELLARFNSRKDEQTVFSYFCFSAYARLSVSGFPRRRSQPVLQLDTPCTPDQTRPKGRSRPTGIRSDFI